MFYKKRVGKKKRLTDPVKIIPFKGQDAKKSDAIPRKNIPKTNFAALVEKQEAKVLSSPTGKLKNGNLSIQELLRKQKEEKERDLHSRSKDKPTEEFSLDDLKMYWRQFAFKQKNAGLDTLFSALTVNEPFYNEEELLITHHVDNLVQLEFMRSHEADLVQFLRASLKNYSIQIKCSVHQNEESVKKMYTSKDKFEEMAKRNPNLETLKKLFKLDIDF